MSAASNSVKTHIPFDELLTQVNAVIGQTALLPPQTLDELGIQLGLLIEVRDTLDRFQPDVYHRSLVDLIAATTPRQDAPEFSKRERRRLQQLAVEYTRPGVQVDDMHDFLRRIQQQRLAWAKHAASGSVPNVPVGLPPLIELHSDVATVLASMKTKSGRAATTIPFPELSRMLANRTPKKESR